MGRESNPASTSGKGVIYRRPTLSSKSSRCTSCRQKKHIEFTKPRATCQCKCFSYCCFSFSDLITFDYLNFPQVKFAGVLFTSQETRPEARDFAFSETDTGVPLDVGFNWKVLRGGDEPPLICTNPLCAGYSPQLGRFEGVRCVSFIPF